MNKIRSCLLGWFTVVVLFLCVSSGPGSVWGDDTPEPVSECEHSAPAAQERLRAENIITDVQRILRTLRLGEYQEQSKKEFEKFHQSRNVTQFVGDHKNMKHAEAKVLEIAVNKISELEAEDQYSVLKNLRQISYPDFSKFIHEIKDLNCK